MKSKKKLRIKQEELLPLKFVLDKVFTNLNLDEKILDYEIMQSWDLFSSTIATKLIGINTFAHRITKDRALVIGVKSAVVANELQFLKSRLENDFINFIECNPKYSKAGSKYKITKLVFELRSK